jgi:acid stress-induced BolA-like protein IbaG/YrbA
MPIMTPHEIKKLIEETMLNSTALVEGEDGRHFSATVISSEFANKNRIQKQQLVYAVLGKYITDGTIHAISLKTFTPEEWQHQP